MGKLIPPVVTAGTLALAEQPTVTIDDELTLRPFVATDAAAVVDAFSTADIQFFHFRRYDDETEAREWIETCTAAWRAERSANWAIVDGDDCVLGRVAIHPNLEDGIGSVSYWVVPRARGRGVATRACRAATRWAHELGIHRVQLEHSVHNAASRRVAQAAGFVEEGIRRGANLHADGWHDMVLYSHLATDP